MELDAYEFHAFWQDNEGALVLPFSYTIIPAPDADHDLIPQAAKAILASLVYGVLCLRENDV